MPAAGMTCLANDFEPSIIAASRPGPEQAPPAARAASATAATSPGPGAGRSNPRGGGGAWTQPGRPARSGHGGADPGLGGPAVIFAGWGGVPQVLGPPECPPPTLQVLVDRYRVMEIGLRHG